MPKKHKPFISQEHQTFVKNYFIKSPFKGLLLFHRLGSGKTCSSIITADTLLKLKGINKIYVLTPGSLRYGWISEYCNTCGLGSQWLSDNYTFITYNYNVMNYLPDDFNHSLVIIDEVHNLINGVKNNSKNASAIYTKIMSSDCKILALSGTPIFNNIFEWSLLGNMLKPDSVPPISDFMKLFDLHDDGSMTPKEPEKLVSSLGGIISYFPGTDEKFYPKVIHEPIIKVGMTPDQIIRYIDAVKTEDKFITPPDERLRRSNPKKYEHARQMYIMAKKRIISRQPLNFVYPMEAYEQTLDPNRQDEMFLWTKRKDDIFPNGWVEPKYFLNRGIKNQYSAKMARLFENILDHFRAKHMIFTFFKEHSGVNIIRSLFRMCGLRTETFSGDLTDKARAKLLHEFNSKENRYGDIIKIILVTDAGAEGITLLEVGHVHILESDTRENKIQQAIGRAVRFKSHINMPKEEQVIHIWRYWSIIDVEQPILPIKGPVKTMDEILYEQGLRKMNTLNSFLKLLIDNSIENS